MNRKLMMTMLCMVVAVSAVAYAAGSAVQSINEAQYLTHPSPTVATQGIPMVDSAGRVLSTISLSAQGRPDAGLETDGGLEINNSLVNGAFDCYRYSPDMLIGKAPPDMGIDISAKAWGVDRTLQFDCVNKCDGGNQTTNFGTLAVANPVPGQRVYCAAKGFTVLYNDGGAILRMKLMGTYQ